MGESFEEAFDANVIDMFDLSPTVHTISEQVEIGSSKYRDVSARVNRAISVYTGRNLGDDWRILIFKDKKHPITIGKKYYFNNNWWLTYNSDTYKNFAASCIVKRCNNMLRWLDIHGNYYEEPAIFDLLIARARDQMSADDLINVQGYLNVYAQLNDSTAKIRENQRFLVGQKQNRMAYKVFGGGVRNFINNETILDESAAMLMLTMGASHVNFATDDMEKGIANAFQLDHQIGGVPEFITMRPGAVFNLTPTVYRDGTPVVGAKFIYESESPSVATVDENGVIRVVAEGVAVVKVSYRDNPSVVASATVDSTSEHSGFNVIISPTPSFIAEGKEVVYTCSLYNNGEEVPANFAFSVSSETTADKDRFKFTIIDGNSFSVKCLRRSPYDEVVIDCVSPNASAKARIALKGMF